MAFLTDWDGDLIPWISKGVAGAPNSMDVLLGRHGVNRLELVVGEFDRQPTTTALKAIHKSRHGNRPSPVIVIGIHGDRAWLCVPGAAAEGASADVLVLDAIETSQAERLCRAILEEPNEHAALRRLASALPNLGSEIPGISNRGMMATHELRAGVPLRHDWPEQCKRASLLLGLRGRELVAALGFDLDLLGDGNTTILRAGDQKRAIAVFLNEDETFDQTTQRFDGASPVGAALAAADRENLPWVVISRGDQLRVYAARPDTGVGRRGRAQTYVGIDLSLVLEEQAGYLTLLFSAGALVDGGTFEEILHESGLYATSVGERLRDRVYIGVVPRLAQAMADRFVGTPTEQELADLYEQTLIILFRLLFVAYAEDKGLLPLNTAEYEPHSLKRISRELTERVSGAEGDVVFADSTTDLWDRVTALWSAVARGNTEWGVPAYAGELFDESAPTGAALAKVRLNNSEFGPALLELLVDRTTGEGSAGPVDFRSLSVREFGTIYEGLLESSLSVAPSNLGLDKNASYIPVDDEDQVVVEAGSIYFHNRSGARKATGSYFTKPFAVEHLLDQALMPSLDAHLARVKDLLDAGMDADAADALFDFRCVDLSMGSGHFLIAALDRIEARVTTFLTDNPIPRVGDELVQLRLAAREHLGPLADSVEVDDVNLLRRLIARRCIYGVDVNPIAVELARLAVWLHTFVPGLPLSFLNHGLICGDSLTGIGTVDEAVDALAPDRGDGYGVPLLREPVIQMLERARPALERLARVTEMTTADLTASAAAHAEALGAIEPARNLFDLVVAARAGVVAMPEGPDEESVKQHPGLEIANRFVTGLGAIHFPIAFPEVFIRERPGFDCILGNPPWKRAFVDEGSWWALRFPGLKGLGQAEQQSELLRIQGDRPDLVVDLDAEKKMDDEYRNILLSGNYPELGRGRTDFYKAFAWRFLALVRSDGRVGVVLPRTALAASGLAEWRRQVLETSSFSDVVSLLNTRGWVFDDAEHRYTIVLITIHRDAHERVVRMRGPFSSLQAFSAGVGKPPLAVTADEFASWSEDLIFPLLPSADSGRVFARLRSMPRFDTTGEWRVRAIQGDLNATTGRKEMVVGSSPNPTVWPVIGGSGFDLWTPDTGERYAAADPDHITQFLQDKRIRQQRTKSSAFSMRSAEWASDPTTLPCLHPRIAFRDIARATDTRTVIAALVPPKTILTNKAPFLVFDKSDPRIEAYMLGVLASIPLDWFARRYVELSMNFHLLNSFPIPRPQPTDPFRSRVVQLAGTLAAVDDRFAAWAADVGVPVGGIATEDAKENAIAEIDAAVSLLYGLDRWMVEHIFETFHPTWNHTQRLGLVLGHFDRLSAEFPDAVMAARRAEDEAQVA